MGSPQEINTYNNQRGRGDVTTCTTRRWELISCFQLCVTTIGRLPAQQLRLGKLHQCEHPPCQHMAPSRKDGVIPFFAACAALWVAGTGISFGPKHILLTESSSTKELPNTVGMLFSLGKSLFVGSTSPTKNKIQYIMLKPKNNEARMLKPILGAQTLKRESMLGTGTFLKSVFLTPASARRDSGKKSTTNGSTAASTVRL